MKTMHNNKQFNDGIINILFFLCFTEFTRMLVFFLFSFTFYTKLITFQIFLVSLHFTVQQSSWLPDHSQKFNTKQSFVNPTFQAHKRLSLLTRPVTSGSSENRPETFLKIRASDWLYLGYEFLRANNDQSEPIPGTLRHQYEMFESTIPRQ